MFLIGGINGAFSAAVPVDFALQDTYWVVAHLHYVLFGGSVFAVFAGLYYWFPKMFGRKLNETVGKIHFVLMFIGFNLTFFPMHALGLAGMPRRIADYAPDAGWNDLNLLATIGGFTIAAGMLAFLWNVFITMRNGEPAGDDPWEGNTLEWATSSPPPPYNFDHLPEIRSERPVFDARHNLQGGGPLMTSDALAVTTAHGEGHAREGGISNVILGMLLFITSEVMFFAGLFAAYFNVRATAPVWPPEDFADKLHWLPTAAQPIPVVTVATVLLVLSSLTCQLGVWGIRRGDHLALVRNIGVTVLLGAIFLLLQAFDYTVLYGEGVRSTRAPSARPTTR